MLHEHVHFFQASLYRLGSLTLTTEHSYYYSKMDQFRKACAASVQKKVMEETVQLQKKQQPPATTPSQNEGPSEPPVIVTADKQRKLVFNNSDFKQRVHCMTEEHQNVDGHWV